MKFKSIIAEQLLLMEDVAKAEKVLKQYGIPLDNPYYVGFKQKLVQHNAIGFLGIIMNLVFNRSATILTTADQTKDQTRKEDILKNIFIVCNHLFDKIMDNRQDLNLLPIPVAQYTEYLHLEAHLNKIPILKRLKRFANLIIDKDLKAQVIENGISDSDLQYYFEKIDGTPDAKTFKQKLNRYKTVDEVKKYLSAYIDFHKRDFSYEKIMKKVNKRDDLKVLFDKDDKVLIQVKSYEGLKAIGSPSWCIYNDSQSYSDYTQGGSNNQYVFFNFSENVSSEYSMIGFTMDGSTITASHLMNDAHIGDVMGYLNEIGVYLKIKAINKELERIKKNREVVDEHIKAIVNLESNDRLNNGEKVNEYRDSINYILKSIMNDPGLYGSEYESPNFTYYINVYKTSNKVQELFKKLFTDFFNDLFSKKSDQNVLITKLMNSVKFLQNFVWLKQEGYYDAENDNYGKYTHLQKFKYTFRP